MLVHNAAAVQAWLICLYEIESRALRRYWIQWYVGSRGFLCVSQWISWIHVTHPRCVPSQPAIGLTGLPPSRRKMKFSYFPLLRKQYKVHHNIKQLFRPTPHPSEQFVPLVECSQGMLQLKRQACVVVLKTISGGGCKQRTRTNYKNLKSH